MSNTRHVSITIEGFIVGPSWMPGTECYKSLHFDVVGHRGRCTSSAGDRYALRDAMLEATRDGDFQSAVVAQGMLHIDSTRIGADGRRVTHSRAWPLERFPSISDMLHDDPDWLPNVEDAGDY